METHIDCIIPKDKDYAIEEIKKKLESVFERCKSEYQHLEAYGKFIKDVNGKWWMSFINKNNDQPGYITGEGDSFSIDVYKNVIDIGCLERFSSLYFKEENISDQLFKIILELSAEFRESEEILIGDGGFGVTDHIIDMVYYENAEFDKVCKKMT